MCSSDLFPSHDRASYGKSIFKENLVESVLGYIANEANPNKIDEALIRRANDLLDRIKKENNISTFDTVVESSLSQKDCFQIIALRTLQQRFMNVYKPKLTK